MNVDVRRDPSRQFISMTLQLHMVRRPRPRAPTRRREFELTFIFPRELQILLERNGFEIEHLYGDYDGKPLDADSPRMIAACRLA